MRFCVLILALASALASASDTPFPDTKKTHWVYAAMTQIRKDHLWYRVNDEIPARTTGPTRQDLATKALFLAIDSQNLISHFQETTDMISHPAYDAATKKWENAYVKSFPKKKQMYKRYLTNVIRLWNYFQPEIKSIAKSKQINPKPIGRRLIEEKKTLENIKLPRKGT